MPDGGKPDISEERGWFVKNALANWRFVRDHLVDPVEFARQGRELQLHDPKNATRNP